MARVTVEDCIDKIDNRFKLVLTAARRARDLSAGAPATVDKKKDKDKNPVVALREIAATSIDIEEVDESLIKSLQRFTRREQKALDEDETQNLGNYDSEGQATNNKISDEGDEASEIARHDIASFTAPPTDDHSDAPLGDSMEVHDGGMPAADDNDSTDAEADKNADGDGGSFADVAEDADDDEVR